MKTIYLSSQINGTSTNIDGVQFKYLLLPFFIKKEPVQVSFKGTTPISSSFFNSSFGELIDEFGFEVFKKIVNLIEVKSSHISVIKMCLKIHLNNELA